MTKGKKERNQEGKKQQKQTNKENKARQAVKKVLDNPLF